MIGLLFMLPMVLMQAPPGMSPAIGTGLCLKYDMSLPEEVRQSLAFDKDGVPRPNRPPNTLFPGDTGCEIGAYQYVPKGPLNKIEPIVIISVQ